MSGKKFGRRGDLWLCLAAVALLLLAAFWAWPRQQDTVYGEITLEGQLYRRIQLTGHRGREVIPVRTERGENVIVVEDEEIFVQEADCPDKICVKTGRLSKAGQVAACLPHKLMIEVKGGSEPGVSK